MRRLQKAIYHHYLKKEAVFISVADQKVAEFLDDLLWSWPKESFLPHAIHSKDTQVCISDAPENINQALVLFNLQGQASPIADKFSIIYDLFDESSPERQQLSKKRLEHYQKKGFLLQIS